MKFKEGDLITKYKPRYRENDIVYLVYETSTLEVYNDRYDLHKQRRRELETVDTLKLMNIKTLETKEILADLAFRYKKVEK